MAGAAAYIGRVLSVGRAALGARCAAFRSLEPVHADPVETHQAARSRAPDLCKERPSLMVIAHATIIFSFAFFSPSFALVDAPIEPASAAL